MGILERAVERATKERISTLVVASTSGDSALKAFELIKTNNLCLIVVTHDEGRAPGERRFNADIRRLLLANNIIVYAHNPPTMYLKKIMEKALGKLGLLAWPRHLKRVREKYGTGIKVCHIILKMLVDGGLLRDGKAIAIAGKKKGSDSAGIFLIQPQKKWPVLEEIIQP